MVVDPLPPELRLRAEQEQRPAVFNAHVRCNFVLLAFGGHSSPLSCKQTEKQQGLDTALPRAGHVAVSRSSRATLSKKGTANWKKRPPLTWRSRSSGSSLMAVKRPQMRHFMQTSLSRRSPNMPRDSSGIERMCGFSLPCFASLLARHIRPFAGQAPFGLLSVARLAGKPAVLNASLRYSVPISCCAAALAIWSLQFRYCAVELIEL